MKKIVLFLSLCCCAVDGLSQVGINTTSPDAQLHIKSTNQATPSNTDGILIPKIDAFPVVNPTAAQQGMMVYLSTLSGGKAPGFYYWDNTGVPQWKGIGGNKGWELTGNAGTDDSINFIGTTDFAPLRFRVINENAGKIDGNGSGSVFFGFKSGQNDGLYNSNAAFGNLSLFTNTSGQENVAIGDTSMYFNQSGSNNMAVGRSTLKANTTGSANAAIGSYSLFSNLSGMSNTANGGFSLYSNITGNENTAIGRNAMYGGSAGNNNVAVGFESLKVTSTDNNTAIGYKSGVNNTGANNIMIGANATAPIAAASNQMSIGNVIYGTGTNLSLTSKIGINEPAPNAKLQISASSQANPNNTDGVIIPKVDAFPIINPTAAQNGMMVFLTAPPNKSGFYYWDNPTTTWKGIGANSGWGLTGNSGTSAATNFMGTTDDVDVVFKRNNLAAGKIASFNTSLGINSLATNTTGFNNVAIGTSSMLANTTGNNNSSIGVTALSTNSTGSDNSAIGYGALSNNKVTNKNVAIGSNALFKQDFTNGGVAFDSENTAIGFGALYNTNPTANSNGKNNVGIGKYALSNNATGNSNVAIGSSALGVVWNGLGTMSGDGNVAIGSATLKSLTTGDYNLAMGNSSLGYNTVGSENVALGNNALFYSTGLSNGTVIGTRAMENYGIFSASGTNDNVAIGYESLRGTVTTALYNQNTAIGYQSITANTSGSNNATLGFKTLFANTSGSSNTAIGNSALYSNIVGSNNIAIGNQAAYNETGSNKLYIENTSSATPLIYGEFDTDLIRINGKTESIYTQLTANGDGQSSIFGYRTRDSQNDGTGYGRSATNRAVGGYNLWGDLYTFGVTGHCFNDFTRTGGVLGADVNGTYWSSLGYRSSGLVNYGVYATAALTFGTGRFSQPQKNFSIGGGFYGGLIGSWSKGNIIGQVSSGAMFASYNSGDEYTDGKQIELVDTGNQKTAAYTVTSTESIVYKKGKINLVNGSATVNFDENYSKLLGEIPVVTTTPMGQCNGLYIASIDEKGFVIKELNNGTSNVAVSWIAVGDRIDAQQNKLPKAVLEKDFDDHINEVMFNENNKSENAKAIWFDGNNIQFGQLPSEFIDKSTDKKE